MNEHAILSTYAATLFALLNPLGILTRILGLLVAAIGMQFVVTGTSDVIIRTIAPEILKLH